MREFSRLSGVEIDEKAFMPARTLTDVVKIERVDDAKAAARAEVESAAHVESAAVHEAEEVDQGAALFDMPPDVDETARQIEAADGARLAQINREAMQVVDQMSDESLEMRGAKMALNDAPDLRVQVDELDGTMLASEFLAREKPAADELRQKAQQGVDVAVTCMFMNNGIGGAD